MINYGKQHGNNYPQEIEVIANNVFVASNITPYTQEIEGHQVNGYEYDYVSYTKDEYLTKLAQDNQYLQQQLLDTQMALVELFEGGMLNEDD